MSRELTDDEKRVDELLTRAKKFGKMTLGDVEKLIERQEAEIERLNGIEATGRKMWHEALAEIERLRAKVNEIDQQLTGIEHLNAREKLELRAEIELLRRLVDEREADLGRMHGETSAREPDDYFTGECPTCGQAYLRAEVERLKAENARLMALLETVAQRMEEQ